MIEINNLTMRYKNGKGVGDINISVDNGEVKGLLGPNGAGKSTTMRSLMGFLIPSTESEPSEGIKNPIRLLIVVDFPAPLGPRSPLTSPLSTEILISPTPFPFLYLIVRFLISITKQF